jgi:hypothetical protein
MKKIILGIAFILILAGAFLFWNSQKSVADDKDGKCCKTECPKYADCDKKCNHNCDSLKTNCQKKCEMSSEECKKKCEMNSEDCQKKCNMTSGECQKQCSKKEGQSQMNNCPKTNCQQKPGCETKQDGMQKSGKCPMQKQQ